MQIKQISSFSLWVLLFCWWSHKRWQVGAFLDLTCFKTFGFLTVHKYKGKGWGGKIMELRWPHFTASAKGEVKQPGGWSGGVEKEERTTYQVVRTEERAAVMAESLVCPHGCCTPKTLTQAVSTDLYVEVLMDTLPFLGDGGRLIVLAKGLTRSLALLRSFPCNNKA